MASLREAVKKGWEWEREGRVGLRRLSNISSKALFTCSQIVTGVPPIVSHFLSSNPTPRHYLTLCLPKNQPSLLPRISHAFSVTPTPPHRQSVKVPHLPTAAECCRGPAPGFRAKAACRRRLGSDALVEGLRTGADSGVERSMDSPAFGGGAAM